MIFTGMALDDTTLIVGSGEIRIGDAERLISEILVSPRDAKRMLVLDSGGGNIVASESLAAVVRRYDLPVIIGRGNTCASGCFLVFAASPAKMFFPSSRIGVHSASLNFRETTGAMAMTISMARSASDLGVPPAIVGKMVTTTPGNMAWLSVGEITGMGGKLLNEPAQPAAQEAQAASSSQRLNSATYPSRPAPLSGPLASTRPVQSTTLPSPGASSASPTRTPANSVPVDEQSPSFQEGKASRIAWEHWFAPLVGDARLGAEYWTGERSKRQPGNCVGPADFQQACLAARQRLTGPDLRRKTDPQYWWGWNSL